MKRAEKGDMMVDPTVGRVKPSVGTCAAESGVDPVSDNLRVKKRKRSDKPLLILDMNGILIYRVHQNNLKRETLEGAKKLGAFFAWKRPHVEQFLELIFEHFEVAIWTSAKKDNACKLVDLVFNENQKDKLAFVWDQAHCDSVNHDKKPGGVLYVKNVRKVWEEFPFFDETNTTIVDDSNEKMEGNPLGSIFIPKSWSPLCKDAKTNNSLAPDGEITAFLMQRAKCDY